MSSLLLAYDDGLQIICRILDKLDLSAVSLLRVYYDSPTKK